MTALIALVMSFAAWAEDCPYLDISSHVVSIDKTGYFRSVPPAELVRCIPITEKIEPKNMRSIMSIRLGDLKANDLIEFSTFITVSNDMKEISLLSHYVILASSPTSIDGIEMVRRPRGFNCIPQMHHCLVDANGTYRVGRDIPGAYLNMVLLGAGSTIKSGILTVHENYGGIEGRVIK